MAATERDLTKPDFSIIVPVHNEENILAPTIHDLVSELETRSSNFELILVENGSTDDSPNITDALSADDPRITSLHLPEPSYGDALRAGLSSATGEIIGHFSVDIVDFEFFDEALQELKTVDLVLGSKLIDSTEDRRPFIRRIGSQVFHGLSRKVLGVPVADTHGIKLMKGNVMLPVINQCVGGGEIFDDELVIRAARVDVTMSEISFRCEEIRPSRTSVLTRAAKAMRQMIGLRFTLWKERVGG